MFDINFVKDTLADATISDLEEVFQHVMERIDRHYDDEVALIDQKMAELKARRDAIRPPQVQTIVGYKSSRNYKGITNPKNPDQVYRTGPRPDWLEDLLKAYLGDRYEDKVEEAALISLWKNGGVQ